MSDMTGSKATALHQFCQEQQLNFIRFDYFGHGVSSGEFTAGSIGKWRDNVLTILDRFAWESTILVGSSMGGWLMLLATLARPERIKGLVGIASAPDFTEDLIWNSFTSEQQHSLLKDGIINLPADYCDGNYPITRHLIEEGRQHLVLRNPIPIHCPVTLLHGMNDQDVPYETSIRLAKQLATTQVKTILLKDGDHRMSEAGQLEVMLACVREMVG